jgi:hypothetical protein
VTRGSVLPAQFIPLAEDCGLIVPIGAWVLREACKQARAWADAGLPAMTIAVNEMRAARGPANRTMRASLRSRCCTSGDRQRASSTLRFFRERRLFLLGNHPDLESRLMFPRKAGTRRPAWRSAPQFGLGFSGSEGRVARAITTAIRSWTASEVCLGDSWIRHCVLFYCRGPV